MWLGLFSSFSSSSSSSTPSFFFFNLKESLKNVERFPGDTSGKLSEIWGGIELKGQLLTEIPQ